MFLGSRSAVILLLQAVVFAGIRVVANAVRWLLGFMCARSWEMRFGIRV